MTCLKTFQGSNLSILNQIGKLALKFEISDPNKYMKFNNSFPVLQYAEIRNALNFFIFAFILFHMTLK